MNEPPIVARHLPQPHITREEDGLKARPFVGEAELVVAVVALNDQVKRSPVLPFRCKPLIGLRAVIAGFAAKRLFCLRTI